MQIISTLGSGHLETDWFRSLAREAMTEGVSGRKFQEFVGASMLLKRSFKLPVRGCNGVLVDSLDIEINDSSFSYNLSDAPVHNGGTSNNKLFNFSKSNFPSVDRILITDTLFIGWQDTTSATPWAGHDPSSFFNPMTVAAQGLSGLGSHPPATTIRRRSLCNRAYAKLCRNNNINGTWTPYRTFTEPGQGIRHILASAHLGQHQAYFILCVRRRCPGGPLGPAFPALASGLNPAVRVVLLEDLKTAGLLSASVLKMAP